MADTFKNSEGMQIVSNLVECIRSNVDYLTEVDGQIGDGDHGINMQKGFTLTGQRLEGSRMSYSEAMNLLGDVLLSEIGGSMGPIYGSVFMELGDGCDGRDDVDKKAYLASFEEALDAVHSLGSAKQGDKTMMDTMIPGVKALKRAVEQDKPFAVCLDEMTAAARAGMESTKDMVAKIGRSARLGERSRGVLDAGSVSCFLIIENMGQTIKKMIG
jgi:dihydroxyacetone kinase-like protein